jgi:putative membrane protein insertion efficiency factor
VSIAGRILALPVRAYQLVVRPILPPACKFVPSCSEYAIEALQTHGAVRGLALASWRLLRCNPFTAGGYDPVPARHLAADAVSGPDRPGVHGADCPHSHRS